MIKKVIYKFIYLFIYLFIIDIFFIVIGII